MEQLWNSKALLHLFAMGEIKFDNEWKKEKKPSREKIRYKGKR